MGPGAPKDSAFIKVTSIKLSISGKTDELVLPTTCKHAEKIFIESSSELYHLKWSKAAAEDIR